MKKLCSLAVILIMAVASVNAQMLDEKGDFVGGRVSGKTKTRGNTSSSSVTGYMSFNVLLGPEGGGYNVTADWGKRSHFVFELAGYNEFESMNLLLGYGLSKVKTTDHFLFRAFAYPYIGYASWETVSYNKWGSKNYEYDEGFSYGIAAGGDIGLRLSQRNFITIGYQLTAPEFEFGDLFDYGLFTLGWTFKIGK